MNEQKQDFSRWLDGVCAAGLPETIQAVNFNLYEDEHDAWSVEMIGAPSFEEDDDDWACEEVFSTRETPFVFCEQAGWEEIQARFADYILQYLQSRRQAQTLLRYQAVSLGFVDGDLQLLYKK